MTENPENEHSRSHRFGNFDLAESYKGDFQSKVLALDANAHLARPDSL